jgi:hypothetical protein
MYAHRFIQGIRVPAYAILIVAVIVIFLYGYAIRHFGVRDALEKKVVDDPSVHNFDGWATTHFFFWAFLGFWFPNHYVQALGISLAWEGFEDVMGRGWFTLGGRRLAVIGATDEDGKYVGDQQKSAAEAEYWYGRYVTDTFFNLAGYIVGSALANRYWPAD